MLVKPQSPEVTTSFHRSAPSNVKPALDQILRALDERPTVAAYAQAAREVRALREQLHPVRVGLLASFTIDALAPYLEVESARKGFAADLYLAPFNSVKQELLSRDSGCLRHQPDVVFVTQLLEDLCPPLAVDFLALPPGQTEKLVEQIIADLTATLTAFRKHSSASVVLHNFARPQHPTLGIYETMAPGSQTAVIQKLNARLVEAASKIAGVFVLDYDRCVAEVGWRNWQDDKMWYLGRAPFSAQALPVLAQTQAAFLHALRSPPRKCLVLDLDNTLWGGVIGEAGLAGIKIGHTYPGNLFTDFQRAILELSRRGVLLALASKNNAADAEEVFRSHPDMILKLEHFAARRISWQDKPASLREIAKELNIGLESFVFFDDNPAEQSLMRQALPQVLTLPVPPDPMKFVKLLRDARPFDRLSLTEEDRRRGEMYREQNARQDLEQSSGSVEEFLASLQMTATIREVDSFAFPRVLDLLHKTNQFNLTTRRHSAVELTALIGNPANGVFSLRVSDRFGDHGIVGLAIAQRRGDTAYFDSFLLSCRIIGRKVETAFLAFLADWAKTNGLRAFDGELILTAKNAPAADFFARHGFTEVSSDAHGSRWRLELAGAPLAWPACIQRAETVLQMETK